MKKITKISILSLIMVLALSCSCFAATIVSVTDKIINNGKQVKWDGDELTAGSYSISTEDGDDSVNCTFTYGTKGNKSSASARFNTSELTEFKSNISTWATELDNTININDNSVDGMKKKLTDGVEDISGNMDFNVSFSKGMSLFGSGLKDTVSVILSVIVAIIWIFVLASTIIDFGCCANPEIADFFGANSNSTPSQDGNTGVTGTGGAGFFCKLVTPACKNALAEAQSKNKNAVIEYIKKGSIHIIAVIFATIVIPSGGLFTFINWLLGFFI